LVAILEAMQTWPSNVKETAERAFRQPDDLLDAWLTALDQFDPMRRQAVQIAPRQPMRQTGATISPIFGRANLVRLV
jgi:hypothetical protein